MSENPFKNPLAVLKIIFRQILQANRFQNGIGYGARATGFQIIARAVSGIRHLVEQPGFGVFKAQQGIDQQAKLFLKRLVLIEKHFVHLLGGIDQRHGVPAKRAGPEVRAAPSLGVCPKAFFRFVVAVVQKAARSVAHPVKHGFKLGENVAIVPVLMEPSLIGHVKRLYHIQAVEPDLIRVHFFVPEVSFRRSRLTPQLGIELIDGSPVFCLARQVEQVEQYLALVDMIAVVILRAVA